MVKTTNEERKSEAKRVGSIIRLKRIEMGYSQNLLAEFSGLTQSFLSQIELGNVSPSRETSLSLSAALNIDPESITIRNIKQEAREKRVVSRNDFGKMITDLRLRKNVTQASIAKSACITINTMNCYETGRTIPEKREIVEDISRALDTPPDLLIVQWEYEKVKRGIGYFRVVGDKILCTVCKRKLEAKDFHKNSYSFNGLHPQCKSCREKARQIRKKIGK